MPIFFCSDYWFLNEVSKKINSNQQIVGNTPWCQIQGQSLINLDACHNMGTKDRQKKVENLVGNRKWSLRMRHLSLEKQRDKEVWPTWSWPPPFLSLLRFLGVWRVLCSEFGAIRVKTLQYASGWRSGCTEAKESVQNAYSFSKWTVKQGVYPPPVVNTWSSVKVTCLSPRCIPERWADVGPKSDTKCRNQTLREWFIKLW